MDYLQSMAEQQIYGSDANSRDMMAESEEKLVADQSRMAVMEGLGSALFVSDLVLRHCWFLYIASGEMSAGLFSGPVMVMMVLACWPALKRCCRYPLHFSF